MAASTFSATHLILVSFLILSFLSQSSLSIIPTQPLTPLSQPYPPLASSDEKVSLTLYYETKCPGCAEFIVHNLSKIFENGLIHIVDLNLVPYGNARLLKNGTIICQHGTVECRLNTLEACVINQEPQDVHFQYIYCVEKFIAEGKTGGWDSCLYSMPDRARRSTYYCYIYGLGKNLELQYANVTAALKPSHEYVPWVTVNEVPIYNDFENFMIYICKAYKGTSTPKACQELPMGINTPAEANMKACRSHY